MSINNPHCRIKRIGVFTSGGDAPGMNAAIRSVVRTALYHDLKVTGIIQGYQGLLQKKFREMDLGSVANIIQRGGTILKAGRYLDFHQPTVRAQAAQILKDAEIDALVCIGGDGTFTGAHLLYQEHHMPVLGVCGTIDNDIFGTEYTVGFDTAINTAMEAIDRIRDTAASHDRLFIVEVMGRNSGHIAVEVGLAGGAEEIFISEQPITVDQAIQHIKGGIQRGKMSSILVTAEGQKAGRAYDLAESIRKKEGFDAHVCILGHIQRGGVPTARDRNMASRMGAAAVIGLIQGKTDRFVALKNDQLEYVPLAQGFSQKRAVDKEAIHLAQILSR